MKGVKSTCIAIGIVSARGDYFWYPVTGNISSSRRTPDIEPEIDRPAGNRCSVQLQSRNSHTDTRYDLQIVIIVHIEIDRAIVGVGISKRNRPAGKDLRQSPGLRFSFQKLNIVLRNENITIHIGNQSTIQIIEREF